MAISALFSLAMFSNESTLPTIPLANAVFNLIFGLFKSTVTTSAFIVFPSTLKLWV